MIKYEKPKFKAVVKYNFVVSNNIHCVAKEDDNGEPCDEVLCFIGEELEYFFTRENGDHFVYHSEFQYGFWVASTLVDIEPL